VWEGIDTHQEWGRNRLAKLAIHILSIVANSAGCERAFSHMGLVHTAIRSKLSVDKVRKTTVVGMEIKREHIEAGLLRSRGPRQFEAPIDGNETLEAGSADFDPGDVEDVLDFDQLAEQLIEDAIADPDGDSDLDLDDNEPPAPTPAPPLTIRLPFEAIQVALPVLTPQRPTAMQKTAIPLNSLFIFPTDRNSPSTEPGIDYFWQGGIKNLDSEMEACEILCTSQENAPDTDASMASCAEIPGDQRENAFSYPTHSQTTVNL
jgi:hypothetical protein